MRNFKKDTSGENCFLFTIDNVSVERGVFDLADSFSSTAAIFNHNWQDIDVHTMCATHNGKIFFGFLVNLLMIQINDSGVQASDKIFQFML